MLVNVEIYRAGNFFQFKSSGVVVSAGSKPQHAALYRVLLRNCKRKSVAVTVDGDVTTFTY